ncbi:hypothetical protein GWL_38660 [Herbaspirillum sp. GW103]|nr:hypothetical protein GWL_38660 [Herbaspirillum sp. GW103]
MYDEIGHEEIVDSVGRRAPGAACPGQQWTDYAPPGCSRGSKLWLRGDLSVCHIVHLSLYTAEGGCIKSQVSVS